MSDNEILPIVIFSLFFGVALTAVGEKGKPIVRGVEVAGPRDAPGHRLRDAVRAVRGVHRGRQRARRARAADHRHLRQVRRQLLPRPAHPVGGADRRLLRDRRAAHAPSRPLHPRSGRARLLDRLERSRLPAHAGSARPVRRAAAHRQLRPAARLFVQSRRLDDVHDLRDDLHRAGLWHRPQPRARRSPCCWC